MNPEQVEVLVNLHHNQWNQELLEGGFRFIFDRILSPCERDVVLLKMEGKSNSEIAEKRKCKEKTVRRHIYEIQFKYRNGINRRLDDWRVIRENNAKKK